MLISTPRHGARVALAASAIAALAIILAPTLPVNAADDPDDNVGVATRPAGDDGHPDDRTRFSYEADPGQTIEDQVYVGNTGTENQMFTVFATDGFNTDDGQFALLDTETTPTDIGSWVTFAGGEDRLEFTLKPDEARLLKFTVTFPSTATPGDHVGGLVASVLQEGAQVSVDRRVATSIFARVSGDLQPRLSVVALQASHQGDWWNPFGGTVALHYTVENPGNVALSANYEVGAATWFGLRASAPQTGTNSVLLPGSTSSYDVELSGIGQWLFVNPYVQVKPFVDSDDIDQQMLPVAPTVRDTVLIVPPWTVLAALVILVAVVLIIRRRRTLENERAIAWMEETEQRAREDAEHSLREHPETQDAVNRA